MQAAVEGGLESAWVADHFVPWARWQPDDTPTIECWTTLTYLAALYPQVTLGTIVLCQSYRNPALLAKMVAALCAFNPGKVVFGIGAGWKEDEYRAYNLPFPSPGDRIEQMAETVKIARRLWTEPEVTFDGRHYQLHGAKVNPRPDPLPPVMIGGGGVRRTLRVVAEQADWWNIPGGDLDNYSRKLEVLRRHCEAVGRDYDSIVKTWSCECVAIAPSRQEAESIAQSTPFYSPDTSLFGTPDEISEQLRRWIDLGVAEFQLRFADFPKTDGIELFGQEVVPRLKQ